MLNSINTIPQNSKTITQICNEVLRKATPSVRERIRVNSTMEEHTTTKLNSSSDNSNISRKNNSKSGNPSPQQREM